MKILRKLFHFKCKPSGICFEKATKSKTIEEKFKEKSSKEEEEEEAPVAGNRKPKTIYNENKFVNKKGRRGRKAVGIELKFFNKK